MALSKAEARRIALSLPGAVEKPHFRKPAVFVGDRFITRVHDKEDAVVIITQGIEMRDMMLEAEPGLFYVTDHYRNRPALLARLSVMDRPTLTALLKARIAQLAAPDPKNRKRKAGKTRKPGPARARKLTKR